MPMWCKQTYGRSGRRGWPRRSRQVGRQQAAVAAAAAVRLRPTDCPPTAFAFFLPFCSQDQGQAEGAQDSVCRLRRCLGIRGIRRRAGRRRCGCRLEAAQPQRAAGGAHRCEAESSGGLPPHLQRAAAGSGHHGSHRLVSLGENARGVGVWCAVPARLLVLTALLAGPEVVCPWWL